MDSILTVAVVVVREDKILLIKHHPDGSPKGGLWGLPAGKLDGEAEKLAAVRELYEETGLVVEPRHLLRLFPERLETQFGQKRYSMATYLAVKTRGEIKEHTEEGEPAWVAINELEQLELLPNIKEAAQAAQVYLNS